MSIAFDVVFGVFVAAIVALAFIAVRWGVRRDRRRRAWQAERRPPRPAPAAPPPAPDRPRGTS